MSTLVIDASALIELGARPAIAEFLHSEHEICAPSLIVWEVGHVVHRSKAFGDAATRRRLVRALVRPIRLLDQQDRTDALADLVEAHKLSFYDAAYLQAALDEDADLLTEDHALLAASKRTLRATRGFSLREIAGRAGEEA